MKDKLKVLSLFDGISCGRVALERAGIETDTYYASEIDESAMKISNKNYPDIIQVGDVSKISYANGILHTEKGDFNVGKIDIIMGGSPCQDMSSVNDEGKGLDGEKSGLFFQYARIVKEVNPTYYLLENVVPKKKVDKDKITEVMGVDPIFINSSDFSAQNRPRLYWSNIDIKEPEVKSDLRAIDIIDDKEDFSSEYPNWLKLKWGNKTRFDSLFDCYGKASCLTASMWKGQKASYTKNNQGKAHKFTPLECERLQTLPENYTDCVANTNRYKAVGNGWTVDVITYIFSFIK